MKCKIEINMDNAAFEDSPAGELGYIFDKLNNDWYSYPDTLEDVSLYDHNGNKVGWVKFTE